MFIGEAPGQEEDKQGRPFVGRAGRLLDKALQEAGLQRESAFITNVVKCRPPNNRPPTAEEVAACRPYLERQTLALTARIVCLLGGSAIKAILGKRSVTRLRGKVLKHQGRHYFVTLHPAAALHNPDVTDALREDLRKLRVVAQGPEKFVAQRKQTMKLDAFLA